jgi:hypothetical protein
VSGIVKTFLVNFALIGGGLAWIVVATGMIACALVSPVWEAQCREESLWCYFNHHPSFGWLGAAMCVMALAAFATALSRA